MNLTPQNDVDSAIDWFRQASPYINAHRGKTLVIALPGSWLRNDLLPTLTHDLTLLSHLGLRLVLCFGLRAQLENPEPGVKPAGQIVSGRRVTDAHTLNTIISASGVARHELESHLSMGLPNTPMSGAKLAVTSGNYVTAQPFGIHHGTDFQHTGSVREINRDAINSLLEAGHLLLLPPLGYSLTGEIFNVTSTDVATECAIALQADKLAFFVEQLPTDDTNTIIRQASADTVEKLIDQLAQKNRIDSTEHSSDLSHILERAVHASTSGVERVHLLQSDNPNALLSELYTRDGSGTLITAKRWENVRPASISDVGGIIELITPLQENGTLVSRSREQLERDIEHFVVIERDGMIVATAAMYLDDDSSTVEIACLATHPEYRGSGRADQLLSHLENQARNRLCKNARILSTHTAHWFIARGYTETSVDKLPTQRQASYNQQRNSKIFVKQL